MDKVCKLSDVEFEELDNASLKIDGITYQLAKVTKYPEDFNHCDICSLADKCLLTDFGACSLFGNLIGIDYREKYKLFFN